MGKRRRIIVCIPRFATGGPLALYALARYMYEVGNDVRVFWYGPWRRVPGDDLSYWYYRTLFNLVDASKVLRVKLFGAEHYEHDLRFPGYTHPSMKGVPRKFLSSCGPDDVVIYPEEIYGNPLGAKNVIRWLLYFYKYADDPNAYAPDDVFISYKPTFFNETVNPRQRLLYVNHYDLDFYKQTNFGEREGTCYLIKKGRGRADVPTEFDGPVIDDMSEREKVELFNSCKRFVSYDTHTGYTAIASMCGCESIVMPEPGKTASDYITEYNTYQGVAIGTELAELAFAAATRKKVRKAFEQFNVHSRLHARFFADWINDFFDARDGGTSGEEIYYMGALPLKEDKEKAEEKDEG